MHAVSGVFKDPRTFAWLAAALVLSGGCVIPGLNDIADNAAADAVAGEQTLLAPQRISPLADENLPNVLVGLAWSNVPGASEYDVYFGLDPNPPLLVTVTGTNYEVRDLPVCTVHYWRVVARSDTQSVSSPTWTFKTRCP